MSTASASLHRGVLQEVDIYQQAPPKHHMQVIRMLASKTGLAARMDAAG